MFVDGHYSPAPTARASRPTPPLTEDELDQLQRVVQTAVGLNSMRGDQIEVVNMQFREPRRSRRRRAR